MNTDPSTPENDANLSALGRELLATGGSKPSGPWVPPTAEELHTILPQYEIVKMLGRGGMGAVYMGRQTALDRPVAIKILSAQLEESDLGFTERFKNEAKAMAKLNHPGIVAVYDFGEAPGGLLYIVMEYVDGTDVAKMIAAKGRLHTEHAMAITAHVCDALQYAHERGIIHRDIKPANIMVGYDGVVKVADFGLAKMTHSQNTGLTQSGMAMGTLHFMAPEALMLGTAVDHRADIYAVGVMLFQMLTGKLPQGMFKMPSLQVPGLDPRYDGIIAKAMMEDREARYQSAREMRSDLDGILTQPVVKADPEAAKAQQPVLPTQARPQRPGGKPVMRPAEAPIEPPLPPPRGSLAWLWVTVVIGALVGGLAWMILPKEKLELAPTEDASVTAEPPTSSKAVTTTNPAEATKERPFENSLGMKFVPVPGTNMLFCIHETRYKDYATYAAVTSDVDGTWKNQGDGGIIPTERPGDHPVMRVSWEDAQRFCAWLSQTEGKTYRLPTDAEWSIAVGLASEANRSSGTTPARLSWKDQTSFPWGGNYPPRTEDKAGNYSDESRREQAPREGASYVEGYEDGFPNTAPVMSFRPNPFGLYDLGGNVWEWCEDWWDQVPRDRVLRGGAWVDGDQPSLLSSVRKHNAPNDRNRFYGGFRVVLAVGAKSPSVAAVPGAPASVKNVYAWLIGTWIQSHGTPLTPALSVELRSDYTAEMTASGKGVSGRWNISGKRLSINWSDGVVHELVVSLPDAVTELAGTGKLRDGSSFPLIYRKEVAVTAPVATAAALVEGWLPLFNGKDLSGWELHPADFPADVQDGAIRIRGSSTIPVSGNMYYRGSGSTLPQWKDFEVICTVKTENKGNSGIFLHASPGTPDKNRANGIEVQVWNDTSQGTTGLTGSLQRVASTTTARIQDGEWFQIKTRVEGRRVQTWLKKPNETEWLPAVDWTQPAQWQPPGNRPGIKLGSGTLSLQNNPPLDGVVWFKEIQFRLLNESGVKTPTSAPPPDAKHLLGRWVRTNMDRPGDAYLMDLSADGAALWTGDNTTVRGSWQFKAGVLEVDWNSRFKFLIKPPASSPPAVLKGTANWPDGKSTEIIYERQAASPIGRAPSSVTTWTDTKGRSLQAKFLRIEGANVLFDIAGKATPIALAMLSPSSQQIAQELARDSTSADELETLKQSMLGLWRQYNNDSKTFYHVVLLADGRAGWSEYPKSMEFAGKWSVDKQQMVVTFPTGSRYELDVSKVASRVYTGTGTGGRLPSFNLKLVHTGFEPSDSSPASEDLANLNFDFTYIDGGKTGTNGLIQLRPDGSVIQPAPESYQKFAARVVEWRIENGYLMLLEADKRCMALFNEFEKKNGKWHLSGQSLQAAAVRHQLVQE